MQLLRLLTGLVILLRPLASLSRALASLPRAIRPTSRMARAAFFILGTVLILGGVGALRGGGHGAAGTAMIVSGSVLALLRRRRAATSNSEFPAPTRATEPSPIPRKTLCEPKSLPSNFLRAGWCRKGLAINRHGDGLVNTAPDDPDEPNAWSLAGAAIAAFSEPRASDAFSTCVAEILSERGASDPYEWNADPRRTQEEAIAVAVEAERRLFGDNA